LAVDLKFVALPLASGSTVSQRLHGAQSQYFFHIKCSQRRVPYYRSLYLLGLSAADFTKERIALLPQSFPNPSLPHGQLVEDLLRAEFGDAISETLMSLPSSEVKKERNNEPVARNTSAVADVHMAREASIRSWPKQFQKTLYVSA